jgi:hypothetical protein
MTFFKKNSFSDCTKVVGLLFIALLSAGISVFGLYRLSEVYFFDRFFYQKSSTHGYYIEGKDNAALLIHRNADINQLYNVARGIPLKEFSEETYEVAVIGDSMAYGMGVREEERFTALLEQELNKIKPSKVRNFSLPGDSMLDNLAKYEIMKSLPFDVIIIGLTANDHVFDYTERYPTSKALYADLRSKCPFPEFPKNVGGLDSWEDQLAQLYVPALAAEFSNACMFDIGVERIHSPRSIFLFFTSNRGSQSLTTQNGINEREQFILKKYLGILEQHQASYVIIPPDQEFLPVSKREGHPSVTMHKLYAELLLHRLILP